MGGKRSLLSEDTVCHSTLHHTAVALHEASRSIDDSVHASGNEANQSKDALTSCSEAYISMPRGNASHQHLCYFCFTDSKEEGKKSAGHSDCECIYLCGCVGSQAARNTREMSIMLLKGTLKRNRGFSKGILKCLFRSQTSLRQLAVGEDTCFELKDFLMHVARFFFKACGLELLFKS